MFVAIHQGHEASGQAIGLGHIGFDLALVIRLSSGLRRELSFQGVLTLLTPEA